MEHGAGSFCQYGQAVMKSSSSGKEVKEVQGKGEVQDLPMMSVVRLMRQMIPGRAKITDEAKRVMLKCLTKFINFVTMEANSYCQQEHRKTIVSEDLIRAFRKLGFDNHTTLLTIYLERLRANAHPFQQYLADVGVISQPTIDGANDGMAPPPPPPAAGGPDSVFLVAPNPNPEPTTTENADADVKFIESGGTSNVYFDPVDYGNIIDD